jgi:hypothetical protein
MSGRGVSLDDEGYLAIERVFCDAAFTDVRSFFQSMFQACDFGDVFGFGRYYGFGFKIEIRNGKPRFRLLGKDEAQGDDSP